MTVIRSVMQIEGTGVEAFGIDFGENVSLDDVLVVSSWRIEVSTVGGDVGTDLVVGLYSEMEAADNGDVFGESFYCQNVVKAGVMYVDMDMLDTFIMGNNMVFARVEASDPFTARVSLVGKLRRGTDTELAQIQFGQVLIV